MFGSRVSYIPCQGARFAESLHQEKGGIAESSHEPGTWTMLQPVRAIFQTSQIREELRLFLLHGRKLFVQFAFGLKERWPAVFLVVYGVNIFETIYRHIFMGAINKITRGLFWHANVATRRSQWRMRLVYFIRTLSSEVKCHPAVRLDSLTLANFSWGVSWMSSSLETELRYEIICNSICKWLTFGTEQIRRIWSQWHLKDT